MIKIILGLLGVMLFALIILVGVQAQTGGRIHSECGASSISINYSYVTIPSLSRTRYIAALTAGPCKRALAGEVARTSNVIAFIEDDIENEILRRDLHFNLTNDDSGNTRGNGGYSRGGN